MRKMVDIIPASTVEAAAMCASLVEDARAVEEVGVLVGVEDAAVYRRPSGRQRECLVFQTPPVSLAIKQAVARVLE